MPSNKPQSDPLSSGENDSHISLCNGKLVEENHEIAASFNDFFIEKVRKIDENISATQKDPLEYTREYEARYGRTENLPKLNLRRVSMSVIKQAISKLKNSNSISYDSISTLAIKKLKRSIAPWLNTVPHQLLLDKLALYGATPETIR